MVSKKTKQEASIALTDSGKKFKVNEFEFTIRKLKLGTLIQISEQSALLSQATDQTKQTDQIKAMAIDAHIKARIIALAIINSQPIPERPKKRLFDFKKEPFDPMYLDEVELTEYFLKTLDSEETNRLTNLILSQMGINDFFQSTISLIGIDLLNQTGSKMVTDQPTLSGEE